MGERKGRPKRKDRVAAAIAIQERQDRVLALKSRGWTDRKVGEAVGVSHTQVQTDWRAAVERRGARTQEELRAEASEGLQQIKRTFLRQARRGDVQSADVAIKAIATHAKINGYEAPRKLDVKGVGAVVMHVTHEVADGIGLQAKPAPELTAEAEAPSDTTTH